MKYLLVLFFALISLPVFAQQNHFIYIQADNQQAFYVKLDKKIMSSSASGYLIIPKLKEGSYDFSIGFAKNEWPEQNVTCSIKDTDAGYLLKNFGEKGWGLFNFQTMDLVMASDKTKNDSSLAKQNKDDAFANVLSNVVNDPGIKNAEEIKEEPKSEIKPAENKTGQKGSTKKEIKPVKAKAKPVLTNNKNRIKKLQDNKNTDSLNIVYVDIVKGKADTINVIMPADSAAATTVPAEKKTEDIVTDIVKSDSIVAPIPINTVAATKQPENKEETIVADSSLITNSAITTIEKKADDIIKDSVKQTTRNKRPKKKPKEPKTDLVKNDNAALPVSVDTTVAVQPEMKKEDVVADPVKTTASNKKIKKKTKETKPQAVKTDNKELAIKVDTTVYVQTEKQENITPVDTVVKTAIVTSLPVTDTLLIKKQAAKEITDSTENIPVKEADKIINTEKKPEDIIMPEKQATTVVTDSNPYFPRSNASCKVYVDDDEYLGLRKKMDKAKTEDEKLFLAHRVFVKKCFSTRQIQRLSLLFATDSGKYKLFDDAYLHAYDLENFTSLESELKDDYYIKRFRVMIR